MIVGSGFATFAITEIANFCTTDNPFEPATLANNINQLFVFAFSRKSISRPCELSRHQGARLMVASWVGTRQSSSKSWRANFVRRSLKWKSPGSAA